MSSVTSNAMQTIPEKYREEILVVPREILFAHETLVWQGICTDQKTTEHILHTITHAQSYIPRFQAEQDYNFKQIIPYMIFMHDNTYFVMQRKKEASETRLAHKYSLGIGGHMRKEDLQEGSSIFDWAKREFEEEVSYTGKLDISVIGILNDDSNDVGKLHLGLVLLLHAQHGNITIKDEHKSGTLMTLEECNQLYDSLESWSQLVLKKLA